MQRSKQRNEFPRGSLEEPKIVVPEVTAEVLFNAIFGPESVESYYMSRYSALEEFTESKFEVYLDLNGRIHVSELKLGAPDSTDTSGRSDESSELDSAPVFSLPLMYFHMHPEYEKFVLPSVYQNKKGDLFNLFTQTGDNPFGVETRCIYVIGQTKLDGSVDLLILQRKGGQMTPKAATAACTFIEEKVRELEQGVGTTTARVAAALDRSPELNAMAVTLPGAIDGFKPTLEHYGPLLGRFAYKPEVAKRRL